MRRPLSVTELAAILNVPKPTMHRIARQLDQGGFLQRELRGGLRGPGPRLVEFALDVLRYWAETAPRHALMQALSASVGETCNLGIMARNAIVYIDRVESKWPFGLRLEPGSRVPLHCTSMGKLFLSEMLSAKRSLLLQSLSLHRYTENTICEAKSLEHEVSEIARRGYSIDDQEFVAGVVCLAVPVRNVGGEMCAALAISAPVARLSSIDRVMQHIPVMMQTARQLGEQLSAPAMPDAENT